MPLDDTALSLSASKQALVESVKCEGIVDPFSK